MTFLSSEQLELLRNLELGFNEPTNRVAVLEQENQDLKSRSSDALRLAAIAGSPAVVDDFIGKVQSLLQKAF